RPRRGVGSRDAPPPRRRCADGPAYRSPDCPRPAPQWWRREGRAGIAIACPQGKPIVRRSAVIVCIRGLRAQVSAGAPAELLERKKQHKKPGAQRDSDTAALPAASAEEIDRQGDYGGDEDAGVHESPRLIAVLELVEVVPPEEQHQRRRRFRQSVCTQ